MMERIENKRSFFRIFPRDIGKRRDAKGKRKSRKNERIEKLANKEMDRFDDSGEMRSIDLHLIGVLWQIQRHLSQSAVGAIHRIGLALAESRARQGGRIATGPFSGRAGRFIALSAAGHMEQEQDENPKEEKGSHFVREQDALPPQGSLRIPNRRRRRPPRICCCRCNGCCCCCG